MTAIRWITDASALQSHLAPGLVQWLVRSNRDIYRARHALGLPHVAIAPINILLGLEGAPKRVGLHAFNVRGSLPVHIDDSFAAWTYLLLVRPGPYAVIDKAWDRTPQPQWSLICFNDHESHALFHKDDSEAFLLEQFEAVMELDAKGVPPEERGITYEHAPTKTWTAIGFDHTEYLEPGEGYTLLAERLRLFNEKLRPALTRP